MVEERIPSVLLPLNSFKAPVYLEIYAVINNNELHFLMICAIYAENEVLCIDIYKCIEKLETYTKTVNSVLFQAL